MAATIGGAITYIGSFFAGSGAAAGAGAAGGAAAGAGATAAGSGIGAGLAAGAASGAVGFGLSKLLGPKGGAINIPPPPGATMISQAGQSSAAATRARQVGAGGLASTVTGAGLTGNSGPTSGSKTLIGS